MFVTAINRLSEGLERDVLDTYEQAQSVVRTRLNVGPVHIDRLDAAGVKTDDWNLRSRSRRALLPFVGDLASGLLGIATKTKIETLAHRINQIYMMQIGQWKDGMSKQTTSLGICKKPTLAYTMQSKLLKKITNL